MDNNEILFDKEVLTDIARLMIAEMEASKLKHEKPKPPHLSHLVTLKTALEKTGMSAPTFMKVRKDMNIPVYRVRHRVYFKLDEVFKALEEFGKVVKQ